MIVIILAAIGTWLLPAGQYNKIAVTGKGFTMVTDTNQIVLQLALSSTFARTPSLKLWRKRPDL